MPQATNTPRRRELLIDASISTVCDLNHADDTWIRKNLNVTALQTVLELRGIPCIEEISVPAEKHKNIVTSRSFGEKIRDRAFMAQALTAFASRAAARLRKNRLAARGLAINIATSRFSDQYADRSCRQSSAARP